MTLVANGVEVAASPRRASRRNSITTGFDGRYLPLPSACRVDWALPNRQRLRLFAKAERFAQFSDLFEFPCGCIRRCRESALSVRYERWFATSMLKRTRIVRWAPYFAPDACLMAEMDAFAQRKYVQDQEVNEEHLVGLLQLLKIFKSGVDRLNIEPDKDPLY